MTNEKLTELLKIAYRWGRDNGSNRSEKNFNDFLQIEAVQQALSITNVVGRSEQLANFCKKISKQEDCPAEFQEIVNKEFWNLIG